MLQPQLFQQGMRLSYKFMPLGAPINKKYLESIEKSKLDILFEIKDYDEKFITMYEEDLLSLKAPNVIKPKSTIIS